VRENRTVEWLEKCGDRESLVELIIVPAELLQTVIMFTLTDERSSPQAYTHVGLVAKCIQNSPRVSSDRDTAEVGPSIRFQCLFQAERISHEPGRDIDRRIDNTQTRY
jgi:hypothetical protein